jgi:subtilase-type serine protease
MAGVQGVAYGANLSAVRKFGNTYLGGPIAITDIWRAPLPTAAAVGAAYADLHRQNVRVVNHSWGSPFSPANEAELDSVLSDTGTAVYTELKAIADNASKYGMLHVWSAGNLPTANASPQTAPNAGLQPNLPRAIAELEPYWLTVVNLNRELTLGDFSKRCGFSKDWCLAAPGTDMGLTLADPTD